MPVEIVNEPIVELMALRHPQLAPRAPSEKKAIRRPTIWSWATYRAGAKRKRSWSAIRTQAADGPAEVDRLGGALGARRPPRAGGHRQSHRRNLAPPHRLLLDRVPLGFLTLQTE